MYRCTSVKSWQFLESPPEPFKVPQWLVPEISSRMLWMNWFQCCCSGCLFIELTPNSKTLFTYFYIYWEEGVIKDELLVSSTATYWLSEDAFCGNCMFQHRNECFRTWLSMVCLCALLFVAGQRKGLCIMRYLWHLVAVPTLCHLYELRRFRALCPCCPC